MSNTERLVMIPLVPHTKRERQTERERRIGGGRGRQWEGGRREDSRTEQQRKRGGGGTLAHTMIIITNDLSCLTATWLRV